VPSAEAHLSAPVKNPAAPSALHVRHVTASFRYDRHTIVGYHGPSSLVSSALLRAPHRI
jgi:hypothetical protein